eukprot:3255956-Rhodomonas_salina.1
MQAIQLRDTEPGADFGRGRDPSRPAAGRRKEHDDTVQKWRRELDDGSPRSGSYAIRPARSAISSLVLKRVVGLGYVHSQSGTHARVWCTGAAAVPCVYA